MLEVKSGSISADRFYILLPEYIDGQEGIREPVGMSGVRLEARCIW